MSSATTSPAGIATGAIEVDALGKSYGGPVPAMQGVSLDVAPGESIAVVGASGCGKSTLLRLVAGFERPTEGRVAVDGVPVTGPGPDRGVVFQDYGLFPWLTVRENIAYGLRQAGMPRREAKARAGEHAGVVGLSRFTEAFPHQLSGGMQQRVGIARVLALHPSVLLMDEPLGALDAQTRILMQEQLVSLWEAERKTVVLVTHSIEEALLLGDQIVMMSARPGRVKDVIDVPFGRPRSTEIEADPEFARMKQEIWMSLRDEVQASMGAR
jgi:NitT/TauT family transport system ATP-binding protein